LQTGERCKEDPNHLTHFTSHFLTTRYRPASRFRNDSNPSRITSWWSRPNWSCLKPTLFTQWDGVQSPKSVPWMLTTDIGRLLDHSGRFSEAAHNLLMMIRAIQLNVCVKLETAIVVLTRKLAEPSSVVCQRNLGSD
jgi:hypothetical protein